MSDSRAITRKQFTPLLPSSFPLFLPILSLKTNCC